MSYNTKNYTEQGGEVTHFGGKVIFEEGSQVEGLSAIVPTASKTEKGIVKIGDGINVTEDGTISSDGYQKPESGIPKSDMADDVKESLSKADTALQEHQSLEAYALISESGYKLNLEMDSTTFVITPKLYDKNNNLISTGSSVDLPLESVVVSGRYDAENKKIILTLKNGSEIDVPVGDLIDGLVSQADFESHTGDTDVHVSDTDRSAWDGKYTKPDSGIPASDLAQSYVQTEEGKSLVEDTKVASYDEHIADSDKHVTSEDKENWDGKYSKPETGIPKTDLSEGVKESLDKADTALQEHQSLASYALIAESGYKLNLEMDSTTFVLTPKLYDKNNNLISTGQSVDLPLESVVVSGSYDAATKKVILTLKDGSTIEFSVADLIDGLVSQTDFASHTSDTVSHVSDTDRGTWNAKYNKPNTGIPKTDLSEAVKESLDKADSALQEHQSLAAYSLITETGYRVELEFDYGTHSIIPSLYDKNNNLIEQGNPMYLPSEGVPTSRRISDNLSLETDISSQELTDDLSYIDKDTLQEMVDRVFFPAVTIKFSQMRSGSENQYCIGYQDSDGNEIDFPCTPRGRVIEKEIYSPSDLGWTPILVDDIAPIKEQIKYLEYPPSVTTMAFDFDSSFTHYSIKAVVFPPTFQSICNYAFQYSGLVDMNTIPATVTSIGEDRPFEGCALLDMKVDENNQNYCDIDGVLYTKDMLKLLYWPCGRSEDTYEVPDGTTHVGKYALAVCGRLKKVVLPASMTNLGGHILADTHLTELVCKAQTPPQAKQDTYNPAFERATIDRIVVPVGTLASYQSAAEWSRFASKMVEEDI